MVATHGLTHINLAVRDPSGHFASTEAYLASGSTTETPPAYIADPDGYEIEIWFE